MRAGTQHIHTFLPRLTTITGKIALRRVCHVGLCLRGSVVDSSSHFVSAWFYLRRKHKPTHSNSYFNVNVLDLALSTSTRTKFALFLVLTLMFARLLTLMLARLLMLMLAFARQQVKTKYRSGIITQAQGYLPNVVMFG